jgi:hypothetical protein
MQNENATFDSVVGKIDLAPSNEETVSNDTKNEEDRTVKKLTQDELDVLEF